MFVCKADTTCERLHSQVLPGDTTRLVLKEHHEYLPIWVIIIVVCEKRWNASGSFVSSACRHRRI